MKAQRGNKYSSTLSLPSALDRSWWLVPRSDCFPPRKDPVPIVREAGWAPGPLWTGTESLVSTAIRSPDRSTLMSCCADYTILAHQLCHWMAFK
jgi:hypothetical protein